MCHYCCQVAGQDVEIFRAALQSYKKAYMTDPDAIKRITKDVIHVV